MYSVNNITVLYLRCIRMMQQFLFIPTKKTWQSTVTSYHEVYTRDYNITLESVLATLTSF